MIKLSKLDALVLVVALVVLLGCFIVLVIAVVYMLLSLSAIEWFITGGCLVLILILWIGIYQYDKHF